MRRFLTVLIYREKLQKIKNIKICENTEVSDCFDLTRKITKIQTHQNS